jgi:hypothetical protein
MSGAWPQTRRAARDQTEAGTLQAIPPTTGTMIGHSPVGSSGTFQAFLLQLAQPAIPHSAARVSDSAFHLLLGLGSGTSRLRARLRGWHSCGLRPTPRFGRGLAVGMGNAYCPGGFRAGANSRSRPIA